jgi:hypothetical protein
MGDLCGIYCRCGSPRRDPAILGIVRFGASDCIPHDPEPWAWSDRVAECSRSAPLAEGAARAVAGCSRSSDGSRSSSKKAGPRRRFCAAGGNPGVVKAPSRVSSSQAHVAMLIEGPGFRSCPRFSCRGTEWHSVALNSKTPHLSPLAVLSVTNVKKRRLLHARFFGPRSRHAGTPSQREKKSAGWWRNNWPSSACVMVSKL